MVNGILPCNINIFEVYNKSMAEVSAVSEAEAGVKPALSTPKEAPFKGIRHPWEDQPMDHKWLESKLFPLGVKGPLKSEAGNGYSHFVINELTSKDSQMLGFQQEIEGAANQGNTESVRRYMADNIINGLLSQEYKIHVQPKRQFVPLVAYRLGKLLQNEEVRKLVGEFKVKISPGGVDSRGQEMPQIVVYPAAGRENARKLLEILKQSLKDEERHGTGKPPRYNLRVNNLLFLAQSGGDLKTALAGAGLLDEYFDKDTGYAFMKGEKAQWQELTPQSAQTTKELSPQEALEQAQLMLQVAQAQKAERNMRWDDKRSQAAEVIQRRLSNGETLDQIITKSAANVRGIRNRMGLK